MVANTNSKINIDINGTGDIETVDVLRQGDIFVVNRGGGDQLSIISDGKGGWRLVNGVADQQSVDNIGDALTSHFGSDGLLNTGNLE
ncbi:hypothetical protein [Olivibacter sp. XZL3]|uniref:hypothetical protein n=1 Tax=Olivibacter sp. XZL3 TaxID=1735116 RepID=UPI0010667A31|nr:hypothetical protein [Olivibacter sp. XZL3]